MKNNLLLALFGEKSKGVPAKQIKAPHSFDDFLKICLSSIARKYEEEAREMPWVEKRDDRNLDIFLHFFSERRYRILYRDLARKFNLSTTQVTTIINKQKRILRSLDFGVYDYVEDHKYIQV